MSDCDYPACMMGGLGCTYPCEENEPAPAPRPLPRTPAHESLLQSAKRVRSLQLKHELHPWNFEVQKDLERATAELDKEIAKSEGRA